jgi:hypothetical protein
VVGTVALLSLLTYGWSLAAGPTDGDERANAVAPGPTLVPAAGNCIVSYAVWSQTRTRFKAQVTLANRGDKSVEAWKLWFLMPGDQVVSGKGKINLTQDAARAVTVQSETPLEPQQNTTMEITGRYAASNSAPMLFQLNGKNCEAYVSDKPGQPSRPVERLSDGTARFGEPVSETEPLPGISVDPGGIVHITPTATSATPSKTRTSGPAPGSSSSSRAGGGDPEPSTSTTTVPPSVPASQNPVENPGGSPSIGVPTGIPGGGAADDDCDTEVDECAATTG